MERRNFIKTTVGTGIAINMTNVLESDDIHEPDSASDNIKRELCARIDEQATLIPDVVKDIGAHPELGFKEFRTSGVVNDFLRSAGYETEQGLAITGVKARLKKEYEGPNMAVLSELDGIICSESSWADKKTGATHNCGHNVQLGIMLAVAQAFKKSGVASQLGGNISFIAAPAEEYIELEYRTELRKRGDIRYFGGKQELVRTGAFDDVDAAMMVHSQGNTPQPFVTVLNTGMGLIAETIRYTGKTAHAGIAPEEGVNALYAAVLGLNAVNAMRETFRDEEHNRVHFIITKGGEVVNSVPADVRLEGMVRASTVESMQRLLAKTERAFRSGGDALGAKTEIDRLSGYLPLSCHEKLNSVFADNARLFMPDPQVSSVDFFKLSTDMGDISHLMPAIHPMSGGVEGALHAANFQVVDYTAAVLTPAKIMACTLVDLLSGNATKLKSITDNYHPLLTKQAYFELLNSFFISHQNV